MKITNILLFLVFAFPPLLAGGSSCNKPLECYEKSLLELQKAREEIKAQLQRLESQDKIIAIQTVRLSALEKQIPILQQSVPKFPDNVNHGNCKLLDVNPTINKNDPETLPHQLTKVYCPKGMYVAGLRIVNSSYSNNVLTRTPIDRVICCNIW